MLDAIARYWDWNESYHWGGHPIDWIALLAVLLILICLFRWEWKQNGHHLE